jgi:lysophospholipase L1-like esterase
MAKAMEMYNRTLLDFCRQSGLECYDLASHIPKDTSAFFDEVHFNEAGARLVAQNLKQYLLSRPPFHAQDKQTEGAPNR